MGVFGRLGLILFSTLLFGCLPLAPSLTDPNPAGIGFGEELFKLQGRVDYLYGHVQRNLQKLDLQVGELQKAVHNLEQGSEISALRADLLRLRDELGQLRALVKSEPGKELSRLHDKVNSLERALKDMVATELKIGKLQEEIQKVGKEEEFESLKTDLVKFHAELTSVRAEMKSLSEKVSAVPTGTEKLPADAPSDGKIPEPDRDVKKLEREIGQARSEVKSPSRGKPGDGTADNSGSAAKIVSSEGAVKTVKNGSESESAKRTPITKVGKEAAQLRAWKETLPRAEKGKPGSSVLLTIYFAPGSSKINPQVAGRIEALASESLKKDLQFSIVSFVPSPTPPAGEQHLAASRARLVSANLLGHGVERRRVYSTISASVEGWREGRVEIRRAD